MESFTIRNFFKQWKAILPLAIILTFAGLILGFYYNSTQVQSYTYTNEVLVVGALDTMLPDDFVSIANSKKLVGDTATENAGIDDKSCAYEAAKSGNVIRIAATCPSNTDNAHKLADSVTETFRHAIVEVYEMDSLQVKIISDKKAEENISTSKRMLNILLPAIAGLAVSAVIAFVKLDYVTSEKRKK